MPKITPFLWYDNNQAEEAANFYVSIFKNSRVIDVTPMVVTFELEGQMFLALNGGPEYKFTEAISLYTSCETQDEVDELWAKLSEGGQEDRCGWLKDRYGLSWQVIPTVLSELLNDPDPVKAQRATQAMLGMNKIDIQGLRDAHAGK